MGEVTDDEDDFQVSRTGPERRSKRRKQRGGAEWELSRTWETLVEGADGTISSTVEGLLEAGKRKRCVSLSLSLSLSISIQQTLIAQIVERHNTAATRHHSTPDPDPGPLAVHVRKGSPAHTIPVDPAICPGVRPRVLRAKPHLPARRAGPARRSRPSNQRHERQSHGAPDGNPGAETPGPKRPPESTEWP